MVVVTIMITSFSGRHDVIFNGAISVSNRNSTLVLALDVAFNVTNPVGDMISTGYSLINVPHQRVCYMHTFWPGLGFPLFISWLAKSWAKGFSERDWA